MDELIGGDVGRARGDPSDRPSYGASQGSEAHLDETRATDRLVVGGAVVLVVCVWSGSLACAVVLGAVFGVVATAGVRIPVVVLASVLLAGIAAVRSGAAWAGLAPDQVGPYAGWVRLVDDPQPFEEAARVVIEIDGERFEMWTRGRVRQRRVRSWRGGQFVEVRGVRRELDGGGARRVAWAHVVGEFEAEWAGDVVAGGPVDRASNRVRAAIERAGATLPDADGALFRGLVVGDDRDQPRAMLDQFRASGLSHLTAVSGQNVGFVLAAAGPLLRRLRPAPRLAATVGLIAWFVAVARFEPSIVRAGVMAILAAVAFATGRDRTPLRLLALAVGALVLIDPLLVWSVGFWLSVGATAGVCTVGPWLAARLARLGILAMPVGITLGAQAGVVVPSLLVFGRLPLVSVPANLLAVPVGGGVMLYGLPAGLVAGWVPVLAPVLMFPARVGVRWVDTVAALGARLEPDPPAQWIGWAAIAAGVAALTVRGRMGHAWRSTS